MRTATLCTLLLAAILAGPSSMAGAVVSEAPRHGIGERWTTLHVDEAVLLPQLEPGFERRVMWDLRPRAGSSAFLVWSIGDPGAMGLGEIAGRVGADLARCATRPGQDTALGCELLPASLRPGAVARWSDLPGVRFGARTVAGERPATLTAGTAFGQTLTFEDGRREKITAKAVAEGVALLPVGVREGVLLRERIDDGENQRLRYRFISRSGRTLAELEGAVPPAGGLFVAQSGTFVTALAPEADDGIEIPYTAFSNALIPGSTGFLQYSQSSDRQLSQIHPGWTSVAEMLSIDQTSVAYQPDPGDSGSALTLPEVWDFTSLATAELPMRTFNTTRDDQNGQICINNCSTQDQSASPPDGTWQYYLKIDTYTAANALFTQDWFALNDNDTGANPSIDVSFTIQDASNTEDATQVCFAGSAGGASRFLQFFEFTGATPATSTLGAGDVWLSGDWSSCSGANGLRLTAASQCDPGCYPACSIPTPFARGNLAGDAGFRSEILEDGFVHMPTGNFIPALLLRQDTDLTAGIDFIVNCALGSTPQRAFDYFWISEAYPLLALVSSPNDASIPPDDWSSIGNITDGVDFAWGPFPPHQFQTRACLNGTQVEWSLPADGSNVGTGPVSDYGYVVSWGNDTDPEVLADFTNPNRTPLPGDAGFLAAPAGSEPTSYTITGWPGAALNATVVTALRYTDPDVADVTTFRSAAFYRSVADPARLDPIAFAVGEVAPLVDKQGADLALAWPAVTDAAGYSIRVYDLDTRMEISCPGGLDCSPSLPAATFSGGAADASNYGFRVLAADACGDLSSD